MPDLILPPGVVLDDADAAPAQGPPCSVCGEPMPAFTDEQWKEYQRITKVRRVTLRHDVCPRDAGQQRADRRFEARVAIVEVTLEPGATDATSNELASFVAHTDAPDLYAAMRPLAEALGVKWMEVEEVAHIADPATPEPALPAPPPTEADLDARIDELHGPGAAAALNAAIASGEIETGPATEPAATVLSTVKTAHRCGAGEPDYPPQGIVCLCATGRDHTEAEFTS